jgi:hypothetical protein
MRKPKLTPWFPGDVKPVHEGVYLVEVQGHLRFSKWTGSNWNYLSSDKDVAACATSISGYTQARKWRGLAQEPKA